MKTSQRLIRRARKAKAAERQKSFRPEHPQSPAQRPLPVEALIELLRPVQL